MYNSKEDDFSDSGFFYPSLWKQRRLFIKKILTRFSVKTVLDYGCGEASVLSFLIPPQKNSIVKLAGIDIDSEILKEAIDRSVPVKIDYQRLRKEPLSIEIFHGSIGVVDDRLKGYQAMVCSEVIEHLFPDTLESFLEIVLGVYQPEILIVTTPNGEYNVNFPNLKYGTAESVFRHDDHKFEWTRKEFETWCKNGACQYNYDTEFHGIGLLYGKENETKNGHCTQACIFIRKSKELRPHNSHGTPHKLIKQIDYPYAKEDDIQNELIDYIESLYRAERYQSKQPRPVLQNTPDLDDMIFDTQLDWSTFNLADYSVSEESYVEIAPSIPPYTVISIDTLWDSVRMQDMFQSKDNLLATLSKLNGNDFKLGQDCIIVNRPFHDSDSETIKSLSDDEY